MTHHIKHSTDITITRIHWEGEAAVAIDYIQANHFFEKENLWTYHSDNREQFYVMAGDTVIMTWGKGLDVAPSHCLEVLEKMLKENQNK
jgi:hypothetical protein